MFKYWFAVIVQKPTHATAFEQCLTKIAKVATTKTKCKIFENQTFRE